MVAVVVEERLEVRRGAAELGHHGDEPFAFGNRHDDVAASVVELKLNRWNNRVTAEGVMVDFHFEPVEQVRAAETV